MDRKCGRASRVNRTTPNEAYTLFTLVQKGQINERNSRNWPMAKQPPRICHWKHPPLRTSGVLKFRTNQYSRELFAVNVIPSQSSFLVSSPSSSCSTFSMKSFVSCLADPFCWNSGKLTWLCFPSWNQNYFKIMTKITACAYYICLFHLIQPFTPFMVFPLPYDPPDVHVHFVIHFLSC